MTREIDWTLTLRLYSFETYLASSYLAEFVNVPRLLILVGKWENPAAGACEGNVEQAPFFCVWEDLRLRNDQVERLIIFNAARHAIVKCH